MGDWRMNTPASFPFRWATRRHHLHHLAELPAGYRTGRPSLGSFPSLPLFPTPSLGLLGSPPESLVLLAPGVSGLRFGGALWAGPGQGADGQGVRMWPRCASHSPPPSSLPLLPSGKVRRETASQCKHSWPSDAPFNSPGVWHTHRAADTLGRERTHSWSADTLTGGRGLTCSPGRSSGVRSDLACELRDKDLSLGLPPRAV